MVSENLRYSSFVQKLISLVSLEPIFMVRTVGLGLSP